MTWEHAYFETHNRPSWRSELLSFINDRRPPVKGLAISLSVSTTSQFAGFHVWINQDAQGRKREWDILNVPTSDGNWAGRVSENLSAHDIIVAGFNRGAADLWLMLGRPV